MPDAAYAGDPSMVLHRKSVLMREVWLLRHAESKTTAATQVLVDWLFEMARRVLSRD